MATGRAWPSETASREAAPPGTSACRAEAAAACEYCRAMERVQESPLSIRVVRHVWIPMRDGVRLSARMWLPEGAEEQAVPAILEYIPYRKDDATLPSDDPRHRYLAQRGYGCVRVDLRGSGDS